MKSKVKNKNDMRYIKNERKLRGALNALNAKRRLRLQVREVCRKADVKPPTFYWRYKNIDDAMTKIEQELYDDFRITIKNTKSTNLKPILVTMMIYISKNSDYFLSLQRRGDIYLLNKMINSIRDILTSSWTSYGKVNDNHIFQIYSATLIGAILDWGKNTKYNSNSIEKYLKILLRLSENPPKHLKSIVYEK